jgi:hypothetical protein
MTTPIEPRTIKIRRTLAPLHRVEQTSILRRVSNDVTLRGYDSAESLKGLVLSSARDLVDELTRRGYQIVRVEESETP